MTPLEIAASHVVALFVGVFLGGTWWSKRNARSSSICPTCLGPTQDDGTWAKAYRRNPTKSDGHPEGSS